MITKKVKEQFLIISVACIAEVGFLYLLTFFDEFKTIDITTAPLRIYLIYILIWLLLKIDILSKILLYLYKAFLFLSALLFILTFFIGDTKEVILIFLLLFSFIYSIFLIAKRELKVEITKEPDFYITCKNCNFEHKNSIHSICCHCGTKMYD